MSEDIVRNQHPYLHPIICLARLRGLCQLKINILACGKEFWYELRHFIKSYFHGRIANRIIQNINEFDFNLSRI